MFQPTDREHELSIEIQKAFAARLIEVIAEVEMRPYATDNWDLIAAIKDEFDLPL